MNEQECLQARQTVDDTAAFSAEQLLAAEQHIRHCAQCEVWRNQVNVITDAAKNMAFFDVPESLTQRIMADVEEVSSSKSSTVRSLILSAVVLTATIFVFSFDPFDTTDGVLTWCLSFLVLFAFKLLLQVSAKNNAQLQKQN